MEEQRQKSDSLRQELRKSDKAKREVCFFNIALASSLLKTSYEWFVLLERKMKCEAVHRYKYKISADIRRSC